MATHTNFKAVYRASLIKIFQNEHKVAEILTIKLEASLLSNASPCVCPLIFVIEAFHILLLMYNC